MNDITLVSLALRETFIIKFTSKSEKKNYPSYIEKTAKKKDAEFTQVIG